jgi:hypothetical protein
MSLGVGETDVLLPPLAHRTGAVKEASPSSTYGATLVGKSVEIEHGEEAVKGGSRAAQVNEQVSKSEDLFRQHHRGYSSESGFVSRRSSTASFISCEDLEDLSEEQESSLTSSCSKVQELFDYMEVHTNQVEQKLRAVSQATRGPPNVEEGYEDVLGVSALDASTTVIAINSDEGDYESVTINTEYVNEEDERKKWCSAFGVLHDLKQEIVRLKNYFDSECTKLDRFVMGGDTAQPENTQRLLTENSISKERFSSRLDDCMADVEHQMGELRHNNDIIINGVRTRPNRKHPGSPITKLIRMSSINCTTWLHAFLFLSLVAMICYLYLWSRASDQWTVCLRLVRSPLFIVLLFYMYGINMKVWAMYGVDYVTIFNHHPSSTPTPKAIFTVASTLTIFMSVLVIVLVATTPYSTVLPLKIISLAMWGVLLIFLLNPCDVFIRKARFNLIVTFARILTAPLLFVYFADFFLADQFNSTVAIFLDMQYLVCYLVSGPWSGDEVYPKKCTSSGNGIRPILSLLPSCWRFLQCLRCYYDTRNISHLINAGKYFTTVPVIVFATFYSTKVKGDIKLHFVFVDVGWIVVFLLMSSLVHSVYTFVWDVSKDWGLWNLKCNRKLMYRRKLVYLFAIGLDFVFRFLWTVKLILAIVWERDSDLIYTGRCCDFCISCMQWW